MIEDICTTDVDCVYELTLCYDDQFALRICPEAHTWLATYFSSEEGRHALRDGHFLFARPTFGAPWGASYTVQSWRDAEFWNVCIFPRRDYRAASIAAAETLHFILQALHYRYPGAGVKQRKQLITLDHVGHSDDFGGGNLYTSYSARLAHWLAKHGRGHRFDDVIRAMARNILRPDLAELAQTGDGVDARMLSSRKLTLDVGVNWSLGPLDPENFDGHGWKTHANNMDGPADHHPFLCGLARLHELARAAGL